MGDVYVYDFYPFPVGDERCLRAPFSATLKAIAAIGTPIMESQFVVDASQVTADGHLMASTVFCSVEITRLSAEIQSLELRASARELLMLSMDANIDGAAIYMLSMESSHLRRQAQSLVIHRSEMLARESGHVSEIMAFAHHAGQVETASTLVETASQVRDPPAAVAAVASQDSSRLDITEVSI